MLIITSTLNGTLNMIFSITYYLDLHDVVFILLCTSYVTNKCESSYSDIVEHKQLKLAKNYINFF